MKTRTQILLIIAVIVVGSVTCLLFMVGHALKARTGPAHVFELTETPAFLAEGLALAKAYATLKLDGVDTAQYEPCPDGRTKAPDGAIDQYLARNTLNSNRGVIMFTNGSTGRVCFVSVELADNKVNCQSSIGK